MSATGEQEILHFTEENSPLLSNTINSIALNEKTGEVYFATKDGLVSYQGDAVAGNEEAERVVHETDGLLQWVVVNPLQPETFHQARRMLGLPKCVGIKIIHT